MSAFPIQDIFEALHDAGLSVSLAPDGGLGVAPASRLTHELRDLIRSNKAVLLDWLQAANDPAAATPQPAEMPDPDRWCWPHSSAMTGREIDTMVARTSQFNSRGLPALEAELLADKLVTRDRDWDDRRLCLECAHLPGRAGAMRCARWQRAGLGQAGIPAGLALQLQRCSGFEDQNPVNKPHEINDF